MEDYTADVNPISKILRLMMSHRPGDLALLLNTTITTGAIRAPEEANFGSLLRLSSISLSSLVLDSIYDPKKASLLYYPLINGKPTVPSESLEGPIDARCPHRYLVVNTKGFGRHHNQLQEIMNSIIWANKQHNESASGRPSFVLNRTVVLPHFYSGKFIDARLLYNFNYIAAHYCLITEAGMLRRIKEHYGSSALPVSSECVRDGFTDLPLYEKSRGLITKCDNASFEYLYDSRHGMETNRKYMLNHIMPSRAVVLVLASQVAFYMKADLPSVAAAYRLLRPSLTVEAIINSLMKTKDAPSLDWGIPFARAAAMTKNSLDYHNMNLRSELVLSVARAHKLQSYRYVGVHTRSREGARDHELKQLQRDAGWWLPPPSHFLNNGDSPWHYLENQYNLSLGYLEQVLVMPQEGNSHVFLASDQQNPPFVGEMKRHFSNQLIIWSTEDVHKAYGLSNLPVSTGFIQEYSLAVDFFLLARAASFTGNQLSSVSQNVCFVRLGNGLSCDAVIPALTLYYTRSILS